MASEKSAHAFRFLMPPEVRFLDAALARLIPADELGPGAKEADVTFYIDGQLASSWGSHGRNYRMGPWFEGTPQQGFQSPLTPQEIYRSAIRECDLHCAAVLGRVFAFLVAEQQDTVLAHMESGSIQLPSVSAALFFQLLWRNTVEGFFADPMYGGNRDKVGWKLVGFPGLPSSTYGEHDHVVNEPYRAEPVSILDVAEGRAAIDDQGYPVHVRLTESDPVSDGSR